MLNSNSENQLGHAEPYWVRCMLKRSNLARVKDTHLPHGSDCNAVGALEYPKIWIDPQSFSKLCSAFWLAKLGWKIKAVLLKIHSGNIFILVKKNL